MSARLRTAEWEPRDISIEIKPEDTPKDVITRNASTLSLLDEALRHASQNYFVASYGPYRRVSEQSTVVGTPELSSPRAQCLATLFDKNAVVHPLPTWAMTLEYRRGTEGLAIVQDALNALMPDVSFDGVDKERGTLRFQTMDGIVTLGELSDGYQNLAAWIGDLLYRITEAFAHHRQPLHARGLLLIDEIDAHLHPAWQRKLREFLTAKLPNFQIIATSYSALTVQQAHEGEVVILSGMRTGSFGLLIFRATHRSSGYISYMIWHFESRRLILGRSKRARRFIASFPPSRHPNRHHRNAKSWTSPRQRWKQSPPNGTTVSATRHSTVISASLIRSRIPSPHEHQRRKGAA